MVAVDDTQFLISGRYEGPIQFIIRPENLRVLRADRAADVPNGTVFPVKVVRSIDLGAYVRLYMDGPLPLVAHLPLPALDELGPLGQTDLLAVVPPEAVHVLGSP